MNIRLIRHASLWIEYAGQRILVDPMFAGQGTYPGLPIGRGRSEANPLVDLPVSMEEFVRPDAILVTHLHFDHLDKTAAGRLSKELPLVCRTGDQSHLENWGFQRLTVCGGKPRTLQGVEYTRVAAKHGRGFVGLRMGRAAGFVLRAPDEPVLYLTGDTVFYPGVVRTLRRFRPDVIVANAGAACFAFGEPVTMTAADIVTLALTIPKARIVAVHMEAVNHCRLTRSELKEAVEQAGLAERVAIPADGEEILL
jgi:L-ascorbate metabolism protein UlaG (beta-lactamase superfamily)